MNLIIDKIESTNFQNVVFEALCTTLETVAFEEPLPRFDNPQLPPQGVGATVAIVQPAVGEMTLWISIEAVREIAMSITGIFEETELKPAILSDVVAELANVLVGQLANTLLPKDEGYTLGLPSTWNGSYLPQPVQHSYLYEVGMGFLAVKLTGYTTTSAR